MSIEAISKTGASYQQMSVKSAEPVNASGSAEPAGEMKISENVITENVSMDKTDDKDSQNDTSKAAVDAVKKAVNEMNRTSENKTVQFGIHEETNRMTIRILDKESRKVVKEFPAEKTLDLIAKAWEIAGIMVDEKR